jgi:hypothetical protein
VVVNAVMRTLTRKAVGKATKGAKTAGGKKKTGRRRRVRRRANDEAIGDLAGSREARRIEGWIPIEADGKRSYAGRSWSVPRQPRG